VFSYEWKREQNYVCSGDIKQQYMNIFTPADLIFQSLLFHWMYVTWSGKNISSTWNPIHCYWWLTGEQSSPSLSSVADFKNAWYYAFTPPISLYCIVRANFTFTIKVIESKTYQWCVCTSMYVRMVWKYKSCEFLGFRSGVGDISVVLVVVPCHWLVPDVWERRRDLIFKGRGVQQDGLLHLDLD